MDLWVPDFQWIRPNQSGSASNRGTATAGVFSARLGVMRWGGSTRGFPWKSKDTPVPPMLGDDGGLPVPYQGRLFLGGNRGIGVCVPLDFP